MNHEDNFFINGNYLTSELQKQMSDGRCYCFTEASSPDVAIYAVSDGMGGHNAGEVASLVCVEQIAATFPELQRCTSVKEVVAYLQTVVESINEAVCSRSCTDNELRGMGATLVLLAVCRNECAVLNIGDSRAYRFHNGNLIQITKDNTEGQRMLDLGLLNRKELSGFPARKNLNRYVGINQSGYVLRADEYFVHAAEGYIVLCSDGISDFVSDTRMAEILNSEKDLEIVGKQLVEEAVASRNADNATLMIIPLRG